jgi:hypothetical protein
VCLWVTGESDASAGALPAAAEHAHPEPQHCLAEVAGKWADPVPDVQAPAARSLRPERSARLARVAPCTPDEVPCGARSCAARALAHAVAQSAPLVSLPPEPLVVAARPAGASQKLEPQLVLRERSLLLDGRAAAQARASLEGRLQTLAAAQLAEPERKMSA